MSQLALPPARSGRLRSAFLRTALAGAALAAAFVGARAVAAPMGSGWTVSITDNSGMVPDGGTVWVMGFSTTSQLQLGWSGSTGSFSAFPSSSGTLTAVALPTGSPAITLDANTALTGARVYFFMGPSGSPAPAVPYTGSGSSVVQVANPPTTGVPPYGFIEITVPGTGPSALPTIDVQTVDGFTVPISISVTSPSGTQTVGQPIDSGSPVNRATVMAAFTAFMKAQKSLGAPYLPLLYSENGGGILNPGLFLSQTNSTNNFVNLDNGLHTIMDGAVAALFSTKKLSLLGDGTDSIPAQQYTGTPVNGLPYPGGTLPQPAIQFVGADKTTKFTVFSPLGLCVVGTPDGAGGFDPILGTIVRNRIAFMRDLPAGTLLPGMFVQGAGLASTSPPSITKLLMVTGKGGKQYIRGAVLSQTISGLPAGGSQYVFSKSPTVFLSTGMQVFGNTGVFADNKVQETNADRQTVLGGLENQLVTALNRGIAATVPTSGPASKVPYATTVYWSNESNFYPASAKGAQNLFSLFMHVGVVITGSGSSEVKTPIFVQNSPAKNARGQNMGQAYGFAFDETPWQAPGAPVPANVPAKFDPIPVGTTAINVTINPWSPPSGVSISNGALLVIGTSASEKIEVLRASQGAVKVLIDGVSQGIFRPTTSDVTVLGLGGDDEILVDRRLMSNARIDGGEGDDTINGADEVDDD